MRGCTLRLLVALVIATGFLIFRGSAGIYESSKFTKPIDITVDQLTQRKPDAGWFNVSDGILAVVYGVYTKSSEAEPTTIHELFVPLLTEKQVKDIAKTKQLGNVDVLVATEDAAALKTFEFMRSHQDDDKALDKIDPEEMFASRNVQGMVATSLHSLDDNEAKAVRGAMPQLAADCVILREGHRPEKGSSVGTLIGGIALGVVTVLFFLYRYAKYRSV